MNTWIFRRFGLIALLLGLAACSDEGGFSLLSQGRLFESQPAAPPLARANLGGGILTLVPPEGFCVDPSTLQDRFALMARCDALGASDGFSGQPRVLITASLAPPTDDTMMSAADLRTGDERITSQQERDGLTLVQLDGTAPIRDMARTYWRAAAKADGVLLGLALYTLEDAEPPGAQAVDLLVEVAEKSLNAEFRTARVDLPD